MPSYLVPAIGYIFGAVMAIVAFVAWRRALSLQELLVEAANRFDMLRKHTHRTEAEAEKLQEKLHQHREQSLRLEQQNDELKLKQRQALQQIEHAQVERGEGVRRLELQTEHLSEQVQALTQQLAEADQERSTAVRQLHELERSVDAKVKAARDQADKHAAEARHKLAEFEKDREHLVTQLEQARKTIGDTQAEDYKALKRRLTQADHLYVSMRGLRDMAEERNQNWERALDKMARWILEHSGGAAKPHQELGPLVGEALDRIGAKLIEDDEFSTPLGRAGGTRVPSGEF